MLRFPIAERELRIGARSPGTYRSRRNIAAIVFLLFCGLYWNLDALGGWAAAQIFDSLSALCFVYTLLAGLILAADSISSEKRDGTLGLLFLTALKPHDLVAGTISATSLKAFYGLLATFPILGISFLLGGVSYSEFGRVCLTLLSTLVFALSLSLLVSCLSQKRLFAISRAALGLIFFTVFIPVLCEAIKNVTAPSPPRWAEIASLFSPTTTLEFARRSFFAQSDFWLSLLLINALSAAMLSAACLILPWIWKDGAASWFRPNAKSEKLRPLRPGVRAQNPFFWLASRQSSESTRFLVGLLLLGIAAAVIGKYNITRGKNPAFENQLFAWSFLLAAAHVVLFFKFAALSTARLAEDRELGALESILVTPLRVRAIIRGQWGALATQLGGPALAVLFLHGLICWAVLTQYSLDKEIAGGAAGVLNMAWEELRHGSVEPWDLFGIMSAIVGSGVVLIFEWFALGWVGMWIALRARHPSWALWMALAAVIGPPTAAFAIVISVGVWMGLPRGNGPFWAWYCLFFGIGFSLLNALSLIAYSFIHLRKSFRVAATQRFTRPIEHDWATSKRWALRFAAFSALVTLLIATFYGFEKYRGLRAWRQLERAYSQRGETLTARMPLAPPKTVPDTENFGAAKIFQPLFDYQYDSAGKAVWNNKVARHDLITLTLSGREDPDPWAKTTVNPSANWALQKPSDLSTWQNYYRSNAIFSSLCSSAAPPAWAVLQALALYSPELDELEALSRRPYSFFPVHYQETHAAFWMHLGFLKSVADIIELRAAAKLAAGDLPGARSDIAFIMRLANATQGTPGIFPLRMRMLILNDALNPIWEGLAKHQWDVDTLKAFQETLSIDLLAIYPKTILEQTVNMTDFFDRVTLPDEQLLLRLGSFPINARAARFYPIGWKYLNQAGLFRLAHETLLPIVDASAHRIYLSRGTNLNYAIRRSHVAIDPLAQAVIPWEVQMFTDLILLTAHTQVSLDQAVIACALERSRLARGAYPENLAQLTPQYLPRLPHDPTTGAPFQYQRTDPNQFILYSPGWNQKDDHGEIASTPTRALEQDPKNGDWVWKYR